MFRKPGQRQRVPRKASPEGDQQKALVQWARLMNLPLISIPNEGHRSAYTGGKLKAMGMTPGVSDLFLAKPYGGLGGFWIELKAKGKQPTQSQMSFLLRMRASGYQAGWFDDWLEAKQAIEDYLLGNVM